MPLLNKKPKYAIVTEQGKIIAKFRLKETARQMLSKYKSNPHEYLKVENLSDIYERWSKKKSK